MGLTSADYVPWVCNRTHFAHKQEDGDDEKKRKKQKRRKRRQHEEDEEYKEEDEEVEVMKQKEVERDTEGMVSRKDEGRHSI